jgi:hypothetical protein
MKICTLIHTEEDNTGEITAEDTDEIKESGQQGKTDDRSGDTRADEIPLGVDPHGIQGIDLL